MGAWGYGLFENDYDADLICEFDDEAGIRDMQKAAQEKFEEQQKEKKNAADKTDEKVEKERGPYYTIHGGGDAPEKVRAHLDSGVLEKLFAKKHEEMLDPKMRNKSLAPRDYAFCFLGACAMSVGCRIPPQYKLEIQKRFLHVGFLETAECQMSQALNGPDSYVEGVPYQADIPTEVLDVHLANTEKQMGGSMMLNVPAPFGLFPRPPLKNKALRVKMDEGKFGGVACGGCGAEKKEGGEALLRCAKCKKRGYCSAECQKAHWKLHKKVCSPPEAEGGGKENSAPQVTIKTGRGS